MPGFGRMLGLGIVLSMVNRLSGPAATATASMRTLSLQTEKARVSQLRMEAAIRAGTAALVGAAGASVALGFTVAEAAKFEEGMARVNAVLKPTTAQLNELTSAAIEAGIKTRFSPRQATEGLKELATAGFSAKEANEALLPVLDLATGSLGQLGVADAAAAASAAVRGFGFEARDTSKAVDTLLRSTQLSNIQARDLQIMLARVSGNARAAGQDFEHVVAILGALRNTGAEASVSATTLRSALRAMTTPKARQEMEKLGVQLFDSQGNFRDFANVVFDLNKVMGKMTEEQAQSAKMAIFGARGMNAFSAVAGMGATKFNRLQNELKNASGVAADFREKMLEPLIGRLVLLAGSISTLATQLGRPLLAPIKILVTAFTKLINFFIWLTQLFPTVTKLTMLIIGITTAVTGLIGIMLVLGGALLMLNARYGLLAKAKAAYFVIASLIAGTEDFTRKQILLSILAEKLRITQTDLINIRLKAKAFWLWLTGQSTHKNTRAIMANTAATWSNRIATAASTVALKLNNAMRWLGTKLTWSNIKATIFSTQATVGSSVAMKGAATAAGIFRGALHGLKVAIVTNPILLLVAGIILAVVSLVKLTKAFWNAKGAMKAVFGFLLMTFFPMLAPIIFAIKALHSAWQQNVAGIRDTFTIMKNAIASIFRPVGRLFSALEGGGGRLNRLFKAIMRFVFIPLKRGFEVIAKAATVVGAVVEIIVQEVEDAVRPIVPAVEELAVAFEELSVAIFGKSAMNMKFWKRFGLIVRQVTRNYLIPMAKVITKIAKYAISMANNIRAATRGFRAMTGMGYTTKEGKEVAPSAFGKFLKAAMGPIGWFFQHGGITKPRTPVKAVIGEGPRREIVQPLPEGMQPSDLKQVYDAVKSGMAGAGRATRIVVENRIYLDGQEILKFTKEAEQLEDMRSFGFGVA